MYSKSTIDTLEKDVQYVQVVQSFLYLYSLLSTLNIFHIFFKCFCCRTSTGKGSVITLMMYLYLLS